MIAPDDQATGRTVGAVRPWIRIAATAAVLLVATSCATTTPATGTTATSPAVAGTGVMTMAMPTGATRSKPSSPSQLVDPAAFAAAIATPGTVTIDVHIPFEGKIEGTDLMIPYNEITAQASKLPADHWTMLAIYCRSGNMSAIAAPALAALGYTRIVELRGGMQAWQASGRPLLTTP